RLLSAGLAIRLRRGRRAVGSRGRPGDHLRDPRGPAVDTHGPLVDVELVALRVGHRYRVVVEAVLVRRGDDRGSELGQPSYLDVDLFAPGGEWKVAASAGADVDVDPVLDRLVFRYDLEPDARPLTTGVGDTVLAEPEILLRQPQIAVVVVPGGEAVRRR